MNVSSSYSNGNPAKSVVPPTGPAALNGAVHSSSPRNHSRVSSAASGYRSGPPPGPHSSKPSLSGAPAYGGGYAVQSPRIPMNNSGRDSPYIEYSEDDRVSPLCLYVVDVRIVDLPRNREMDQLQAFRWLDTAHRTHNLEEDKSPNLPGCTVVPTPKANMPPMPTRINRLSNPLPHTNNQTCPAARGDNNSVIPLAQHPTNPAECSHSAVVSLRDHHTNRISPWHICMEYHLI